MTKPTLQYFYKKWPTYCQRSQWNGGWHIVNSKCGTHSIVKNAVINSFIETQRLTLSKDKSEVVHIGRPTKCRATEWRLGSCSGNLSWSVVFCSAQKPGLQWQNATWPGCRCSKILWCVTLQADIKKLLQNFIF